MNSLLFPSKLVGERITLTFPFQDELGWGEIITAATVFAEVYSGTDLDPERVVYQFPIFLDGINVLQKVQAGVPGVIYQVTCRIVGSLGTEAEKSGYLAIIPGTGIAPPFVATYFTSTPYPTFNADGLDTSVVISAGVLDVVVIRYTESPEAIDSSVLITFGHLGAPLVVYTIPTEGIDTGVVITAGVLDPTLITYTVPAEGIDTSVLVATGILDVVLVTYTAPPEGIDSSVTITSGSLT